MPGEAPSGGLSGWLRMLEARHPAAIDLGLDRVEAVRAQMELRLDMPVVLVGGTNGKGSVCAMLAAFLRAGGARTGCYTSPHILRFSERVAVDGEPASDDDLLDAFEKVEAAREAAGESLTYFEFTTLAAAQIFADRRCDAAILEVGLGGRLDAVNIFEPSVSAVSSLGIDHQEFLGGTLESIAKEKAGIFRLGKPAVSGDGSAPLVQAARNIGADLRVLGRDFHAKPAEEGAGWRYEGRRRLYNLPLPAMRGTHQLRNAATAIAALESLPESLWPGAGGVRRGLHEASAPARAQVLPGAPPIVLDVAHNVAAAEALERTLFDMGYFPQTAAVLGMQPNKDAEGFARALARRIDVWHVAQPRGGGMDAAALAAAVRAGGGSDIVECESVSEASARARDCCGESGRILVTGSFMTVADFMQNESPDAGG